MSYIRWGYLLKYVEGKSKDYIFEASDIKGCFIEDYGSISNETIVELLFILGENNKDLIMSQMAKRLAENLNIKLRKKPLTFEEQLNSKKEQKVKKR